MSQQLWHFTSGCTTVLFSTPVDVEVDVVYKYIADRWSDDTKEMRFIRDVLLYPLMMVAECEGFVVEDVKEVFDTLGYNDEWDEFVLERVNPPTVVL